MAAGYLNFPRGFQDMLRSSHNKISILTAAPVANGFYNSKGVSKWIPFAYNYLLYLFFKRSMKNSVHNQITVYEYARPGWTWHGKGIWLEDKRSKLFCTAVGSSNYNFRSFERDLEAQLYIVTNNNIVQEKLQGNLNFLYRDSIPVSLATIIQRPSPLSLKLATHMLKRML